MKKIMTLVIGVSLLFPSGAVFAKERQGVQLEITKTDGTKIEGELIAIKQDSTLLLPAGSIDVSEVKIIKIRKGSNDWPGFVLGFLAVGTVGGGLSYFVYTDWGGKNVYKKDAYKTGVIVGAIGGLVGGLLGAGIWNSSHKNEIFQIEGKPQEEIMAVLEKLRTQARFLDYQ